MKKRFSGRFFGTILSAVMIAVLLILRLFAPQGIPVLPNQGGTVTGVLRTAAGAPAAGTRVSALARPDAITDLAATMALAGLAETDEAGRYRLENIPPGRYYVVAGRIDVPTFYPGTVIASEGKIVAIAPGAIVSGIDFVLNNLSLGRAVTTGGASSWLVRVQTTLEGGGKVPIFAGGRFPVLRLARTDSAPVDVSVTATSVSLPRSEYRATIEDLPDGYLLKSLTFGPTDLSSNVLQLGASLPNASSVPVSQSIKIVITRRAGPTLSGVRVSGWIHEDPNRAIYISGKPGTIYTDGTFEFAGVAPGRYSIVTLDNPGSERPMGAAIVVGDRDFSDVSLGQISIAPRHAEPQSMPVDGLPANTQVPLAAIRGRMMDSELNQPFTAGKVVVNNDQSLTFSLNGDGRFEIPRLLPGTYALDLTVYGIGTLSRTVELSDKDLELSLSLGSER